MYLCMYNMYMYSPVEEKEMEGGESESVWVNDWMKVRVRVSEWVKERGGRERGRERKPGGASSIKPDTLPPPSHGNLRVHAHQKGTMLGMQEEGSWRWYVGAKERVHGSIYFSFYDNIHYMNLVGGGGIGHEREWERERDGGWGCHITWKGVPAYFVPQIPLMCLLVHAVCGYQ